MYTSENDRMLNRPLTIFLSIAFNLRVRGWKVERRKMYLMAYVYQDRKG